MWAEVATPQEEEIKLRELWAWKYRGPVMSMKELIQLVQTCNLILMRKSYLILEWEFNVISNDHRNASCHHGLIKPQRPRTPAQRIQTECRLSHFSMVTCSITSFLLGPIYDVSLIDKKILQHESYQMPSCEWECSYAGCKITVEMNLDMGTWGMSIQGSLHVA